MGSSGSCRYFGTDGIRGQVGTAPITVDFMLQLGWAVGRAFSEDYSGLEKQDCHILIGKDTRISGYMFESALEAGLVASGVNVGLLGVLPTPGIACLTNQSDAQAGIVISASHNPYQDNGIKFFLGNGEKLPDSMELIIESFLDKPLQTRESHLLGKAYRIHDAIFQYQRFCKNTVIDPFSQRPLDLKGLTLVVDCANGATYQIAPALFADLGACVIPIENHPDGLNINAACGSTALMTLTEKVLLEKADLGIAFDGDGDRVIMVDHTGAVVDGDTLLYLITQYYLRSDRMRGGVVGTVMSNLGLEEALNALNVPFKRSAVGDRYVMEILKKENWILGGENSGHLICLDKTSTGDGIISSLQVLSFMQQAQQSLHQLAQGLNHYPQILINVPVILDKDPLDYPSIQSAIHVAEKKMQHGRILLRRSGTEPVVRVMVEGEDPVQVKQVAEKLAAVVSSCQ